MERIRGELTQGLLLAAALFAAILLGGVLGGVVGGHCPSCSADPNRLLIGAGTTGALGLGTAIYLAWRRRWLWAGALLLLLLPAMLYSADLAQSIGVWWDQR